MPFTVTTPPALEPVSLAEMKLYLRLDGTTEDALVSTLITSARQQVEDLTRRRLITQALAATYADFPSDLEFRLPVGNVLTVASVKYYSETNVLSAALSASNYYLINAEQPPKLRFIDDFDAPEVYERSDAVVVSLTAGYGPAASDVPESLRLAIRMMAAYWFEQRLPVNVGNIVNPMPIHARSIINRYRVVAMES